MSTDICTCSHERVAHYACIVAECCHEPGCKCNEFEGGDDHDDLLSTEYQRSSGADVTGLAVASPPATAGTGHGERRPEPASATATAGPTLHQAIQAATKAIRDTFDWDGGDVADVMEVALMAAAPILLQQFQQPSDITMDVLVHGWNYKIPATRTTTLDELVAAALAQGNHTGRPAADWEVRDAAGVHLDPYGSKTLEELNLHRGGPDTRLYLNLRAGVGG